MRDIVFDGRYYSKAELITYVKELEQLLCEVKTFLYTAPYQTYSENKKADMLYDKIIKVMENANNNK